jgi:predicted RNase H-like HicB family nuclease
MAKPTTTELKLPPVYVASLEPEDEGGYSVSFPDLEGCFTQGDTFEDAVRYAAEAAAQWLEARGSYPAPSDPRRAAKDIVKSGGIPAAIEVPALKVKSVPVTISLPETVLQHIDMAAEMRGLSRSGFISFATLQAMHLSPDVFAGKTRKPRRSKQHA